MVTFSERRVKILGKIYLLIADTIWLVEKKKTYAWFYLTHFFTLTWSSFNFSRLFFTHVISLASPLKKIVNRYFKSQSSTTIGSLSSHLYLWWFVNWRNLGATWFKFSGTCLAKFETQSSHIIATLLLSLCSRSQVNKSLRIMRIHTSL